MELHSSFILRSLAIIELEDKYLMMQQVLDSRFYPVSTEVADNEVTQEAVERLVVKILGGQVEHAKLVLIEESMNQYSEINQRIHEIAFYYQIKVTDTEKLKEGIEAFNHQKNPQRQFVWVNKEDLDQVEIYPEMYQQLLINPSDKLRVYRSIPQK